MGARWAHFTDARSLGRQAAPFELKLEVLAVDGDTAAHLTADHVLVPVTQLWHPVSCFPAISEVWLRLLEAYRNRSANSP